MRFDGKKFASEIEDKLIKSGKLKGKSLLIYQCDGTDNESTYVRLKREAGERLGVSVRVEILKSRTELVKALKSKNDTDGILVQLPIIGVKGKELTQTLNLIPAEKDVDGLNEKSGFVPAAVLAVEKILKEFERLGYIEMDIYLKVGIVGALGSVGKRLVDHLRGLGYVTMGFDQGDDLASLKDCDVVVGVTGEASLIKATNLTRGVCAIDLGYPKADFEAGVENIARIITPVPGGVGPVTVMCLFENLAK